MPRSSRPSPPATPTPRRWSPARKRATSFSAADGATGGAGGAGGANGSRRHWRPPSASVSIDMIGGGTTGGGERSEEHTSELQSLMRISSAVFCLKTKNTQPAHKRKKKTHHH